MADPPRRGRFDSSESEVTVPANLAREREQKKLPHSGVRTSAERFTDIVTVEDETEEEATQVAMPSFAAAALGWSQAKAAAPGRMTAMGKYGKY